MRRAVVFLFLVAALAAPLSPLPGGVRPFEGGVAHAQARASSGEVTFVAGSVQASSGGPLRALRVGDPVYAGDSLVTGATGHLHIRTVDKGFIALRPNSRASIEIYEFDAASPGATRIRLKLESGVMRSVSGEGAQAARQNFRLNTPVAAIGIRGTDFSVSTTEAITRAVVRSGAIVVSAFSGDCRPDALGPCGGDRVRLLSGEQAGKLIELRRGQTEPALLDIRNGSGAPDQVAPPAPSEPRASLSGDKAGAIVPQATAVSSEASLGVLLVGAQTSSGPPPEIQTPPVVSVPVPEPEPPTATVSWGRWQPVVGAPAGVSVDAFLAQNGSLVAMNRLYLLAISGSENLRLPTAGVFNFRLDGAEAYLLDVSGAATAATVQGGTLAVDFGRAQFSTSLDVSAQSVAYALRAQGRLSADGGLTSNIIYSDQVTNMNVRGALGGSQGERAAYLFDRTLNARESLVGAVGWQR